MYALTFCYEGCDNNEPYAQTIAVSEDVNKLREEMEKCIEEDCKEPNEDEDEWDDSCNYQIYKKYGDDVYLQHRRHTNLYTTYKINKVNVL